jgi:competence protein ComEA
MTEVAEVLNLNPNTADAEELESLPGVGGTLADRIVSGRPYASLDDLRAVSGLGPKVLNSIAPSLTFELPPEEKTGEAPAPISSVSNGDRRRDDGRALAWMVLLSLASVVVSVGITLGILLAINGTLNAGRHAEVRSIQSDLRSLNAEVGSLGNDLELVESRLSGLQGLTGRMEAVEADMSGVQSEVDSAQKRVAEIQDRMARLEATLVEWVARAERFETFLEGMRNLLGELDPLATTTDTPSEDVP